MAELGDTTDPKALVPGEAVEIRKSTVHLTAFGDAMVRVGDGFKRLDTGGWTGPAADAYHQRTHAEPTRWLTAGDSFHAAAGAINRYATTLDWAQDQACQAIGVWNHAQDTTQQAKAAHDQHAGQAAEQAAANGQPPPPDVPFDDPGETLRAQARDQLAKARVQLTSAGDEAVAQVDKAQQGAPQEPSFLDEVGDTLASAGTTLGENWTAGLGDPVNNLVHGAGDLVGGVLHTAGDIVHEVGDEAGDVLGGVGDLVGSQDLKDAGTTVTSSLHDAGDAVHHAGDVAGTWIDQRGADAKAFLDGTDTKPPGPHYVIIDQGKYPEAADHAREAQMGTSWRGDESFHRTQPAEVTIDRDDADDRRAESMKQVPKTMSGYDRDEYPPAVFQEGGTGSSVKYIGPGHNRGAGRAIANQITGLDNGESVTIVTD
ncbi:MAG TPA: NucA/NucB deoxyribonuclease domain-containing protein [Pseudonocardiaceae bacterium]